MLKNNNNNNNIEDIFKQRRDTKKILEISRDLVNLPYMINMWENNRKLYGNIDLRGSEVYPSRGFLKNINNDDEVYLINAAAIAYNDFYSFIQEAKRKNKIPTDSPYYNFEAKRGWEDFNNKYHDYMKEVFKRFAQLWKNNIYLDQNITNLESFIDQFFVYANMRGKNNFPLTKTGFVRSSYNNFFTSGLIFEIEKEKYDSDRKKVEKFFSDSSFKDIAKAALRFSFRIDSNAPWRFIFDLKSKSAKRYFNQVDSSLGDFFSDFYYKTQENEIEILKYYLISFYNNYIYNNINYKINNTCARGKRYPIPEDSRDTPKINSLMLRKYIELKIQEANIDLDPFKFYQQVAKKFEKNDLKSAAEYVSIIVRSKRTLMQKKNK